MDHITVEDAGDGVPAKFAPNLFHRFTRSESTLNADDGSGLGLAIAGTYTNAHGGELRCEAAHPRGARPR